MIITPGIKKIVWTYVQFILYVLLTIALIAPFAIGSWLIPTKMILGLTIIGVYVLLVIPLIVIIAWNKLK